MTTPSSPGLPVTLPLAIPASWTPEQAQAVIEFLDEHCQINFKAPALDEEGAQLCSTELTPLGKSGGAVELEIFAAVEMTLLIEMIVYG